MCVSTEAVDHWRDCWHRQRWTERGARDDAEPWALPLVVRVEKAEPPDHNHAMYAAAIAVVRLLADPESAPGGAWHAVVERWMDGRIRKVVRRARGIRWKDVSGLPGVTARVGRTEIRCLVPHPVADAPPEVAKLQVEGLDLDSDPDEALESVAGSVPGGPALSIVIAPGLQMSTGKACAQVGHAAQVGMLELDDDTVRAWTRAGFPLRVVSASPRLWSRILRGKLAAAVVRDAGYTEVEPGTVTCAATFHDVG